jgi:hypothetical protein
VSECRTYSEFSTTSSLLLLAALLATGCVAEEYPVVLPVPGASVPLSIDGELRMKCLDGLSPRCVDFVHDAQIAPATSVALLVPGGDSDSAATSFTVAQALREDGYRVRRTNRRHLAAGETLVELFPVTDGALHLDGGKFRGWRIEVDVRIFRKSEEPAVASKRLVAQSVAPIPRP